MKIISLKRNILNCVVYLKKTAICGGLAETLNIFNVFMQLCLFICLLVNLIKLYLKYHLGTCSLPTLVLDLIPFPKGAVFLSLNLVVHGMSGLSLHVVKNVHNYARAHQDTHSLLTHPFQLLHFFLIQNFT